MKESLSYPYYGDMRDRRHELPLFAVATAPSVIVDGRRLLEPILREFIGTHRGPLLESDACVGTWFGDDRRSYVAVTTLFCNRHAAIRYAMATGERAIYDLVNGVEIAAR